MSAASAIIDQPSAQITMKSGLGSENVDAKLMKVNSANTSQSPRLTRNFESSGFDFEVRRAALPANSMNLGAQK